MAARCCSPKADESEAAWRRPCACALKLQFGFNRRFDSNFLRVRQAVLSGEIGTPNLFHIVSRDPFPPLLTYLRPSGGIFLDMMVHDFDMARFLIGHEVEEVFAAGAVMVDPGFAGEDDFDTAVVILRFRGGAIGTIDNSRKSTFGYDQRVEILGSKGKIASENRYPNQVMVSGEKCVYSDLPYHFFMQRYTDSFTAEIQAFTEAVLEDKPSRSLVPKAVCQLSWRWQRESRAKRIVPSVSARSPHETFLFDLSVRFIPSLSNR